MLIKQFEIWIADLSPRIGTESGKTKPVVIVQSNLLNKAKHPSTIICPITTHIQKEAKILRIHLKKGMGNVNEDSAIMIDQLRAIDNQRLIKKLGDLPAEKIELVKENILLVLDLE